jgi:hypothetical protein
MVLLHGYSDRLFEGEGWFGRLGIGWARSTKEWDRERDNKQRKSSSGHLFDLFWRKWDIDGVKVVYT